MGHSPPAGCGDYFCINRNVMRAVFISSFLALLLYTSGYSQYMIRGQVTDAVSNEPLAFVNIIFNQNVFSGTTTDVNGHFTYTSPLPLQSLTCSYVGYEKRTLDIAQANVNEPLLIRMHPSSYVFDEIVVKAGENPANRIIREVLRNKNINNPEKIASFSYTSYNKVIYDFDFSDTLVADSEKIALDKVFKGGHLLVMESVTERKFIRPDNNEEKILGTRVSGFKDASFAPLATDVQPFSFYEEVLTIIDIAYLNPISNGCLSKYDYSIKDTLFQGMDTTYILSFAPQPGKNFEGLTGLLYINTNKYAIQNVIARPFRKGFIDINLQQQYRFVDGKQWFPEQLKFELFVRQNEDLTVGVRASGLSIIKDVNLLLALRTRDFGIETISIDELASDRDSLFWDTHRPVPLNLRETTTYQVMDSLGQEYKFDAKLKLMEKLGQNRLPIHFIDLDLSRLLRYNMFEGVRIGLGAYTNDKLVKNFSVGGFFGYGLKDHQWKYGGEAILTIQKEKELMLTARYQSTLLETGKSWLSLFTPRQFDYRTFIASQMDRIDQSTVSLGFRALRYARVNVSFNNTRTNPQYAYTYQADDGVPVTDYTHTDITVNLRYAFKEKLVSSMGQRISMGTKYPTLSLTYTRGLNDVLSGMYMYNKLEARIEESTHFRNFGESRIRIDAGFIDHPLPYGILFTGEGSYVRRWSILIKNTFMTARPYEFLSDRYVHVHYTHDFGSYLFHIGNWRPSISIYQNMGWGSLSHPEYHQGIAFKTKEKGMFESGLQLDNLLKLKYLNVGYMGFGAGAFVRYGPYATGRFADDAVFTFSMTFTTK